MCGKSKERLPVFRERFNILMGDRSTTDYAAFLGLSRQTVGLYLNGDRIPDAKTLLSISERLGVSSDYLLGISPIVSQDPTVQAFCNKTSLSEIAVSRLLSQKLNATEIFLINFLLEAPPQKLEDFSNKFLAHLYSLKVVNPVIEENKENLHGKNISGRLFINGDKLPEIPLDDIADFTRFSLTHSLLRIVEEQGTE